MSGLKKYLQETQTHSVLRVPKTVHGVEIHIINPGKFKHPDWNWLVSHLRATVKSGGMRHLKGIKIGDFSSLNDHNYKSYYKDGMIYLSNNVSFIEEFVDNFFHELAHSYEKVFYDRIYGDGFLEKEFLNKRNKLKNVITMYEGGMAPPVDFTEINYTPALDEYLVSTIGYDKLWQYCSGIFSNPYAATSLREYFASGFEKIARGDAVSLDRLCPVLYNKIKQFF